MSHLTHIHSHEGEYSYHLHFRLLKVTKETTDRMLLAECPSDSHHSVCEICHCVPLPAICPTTPFFISFRKVQNAHSGRGHIKHQLTSTRVDSPAQTGAAGAPESGVHQMALSQDTKYMPTFQQKKKSTQWNVIWGMSGSKCRHYFIKTKLKCQSS